MSGAAPIIGIASQALGMFGGGGGGTRTVYQPDPRAKYEVDTAMFQRALENQRLAEDVLNGQIATQQNFAKYQYDLQAKMIDQEAWEAQANLEAQYNMSLFNQSAKRLGNEVERYVGLAEFQRQRAQNQFEYEQQMNRLGLRADEIELSERGIARDKAGVEFGYNRTKESEKLQRSKLDLDAAMDKQRLSLVNKQLDLQKAGLQDARTKVNYDEQALDLAQIEADTAYAQQQQGLSTKESQSKVAESLDKMKADAGRKEMLRNLSVELSDRNKLASQYLANLVATGRTQNEQTKAIRAQMINDESTQAARGSIMDNYARQLGLAELTQGVTQAEIDQQRRNLNQNQMLTNQGIRNQYGQLDLARSELGRQNLGLDLNRQQANQDFVNSQTNRGLQRDDLDSQSYYDLMSKSLLPMEALTAQGSALDLQRENAIYDSQAANFGNYLNQTGSDLQRHGFDVGQGMKEAELDLTDSAMVPMFQAGLGQLREQRTMNDASNWARYQQQLGQAQLAQAAGLNQLGAQTHGVLSNLGGYQNPAPVNTGGGGGGFNVGALGGLAKSIMGALSYYDQGSGSSGSNGWGSAPINVSSGSPGYQPGSIVSDYGNVSSQPSYTSPGGYIGDIPAPYLGRK